MFKDDDEPFWKFIDAYGTHYYKEGYFGGMLHTESIIEYSYAQNKTASEITANVEAKYKNFLMGARASASLSSTKSNDKTEFDKFSTTESSNFGGNPFLPGDNINDWITSLYDGPILLKGKLAPIENLIFDTEIHNEVTTAITFKKLDAALENVRNTLNLLQMDSNDRKLIQIELHSINGALKDFKGGQLTSKHIWEKIDSISNTIFHYHGKFKILNLLKQLLLTIILIKIT